ncbi:Phox homologous domain-containing protein [Sporodiniella umbellata]|nr:Phox homologous domain-containing protein [Sporodiniella umbellata]
MSEIVQAIYIPEAETRFSPKPHTVYKIEVHAAVRNWTVWKRYSEFYKLDTAFQTIFSQHNRPIKLPPKHFFPSTFSDPERIDERRRKLEDYLRAILSSRDDRWRLTDIWREFLSIPTGKALQESYTSEGWLDEHHTLSQIAREVRSLTNRKHTHMARNEISASHHCTVQAKKLLVHLASRLSALESGLQSLTGALSEGELRRRQDLLSALKDEKDGLLKLANTTVRADQSSDPPVIVTQERKALLGDEIRKGRAFGAAYKKQQEETEVTRGLNNEGLLMYQQDLMNNQDKQVEQFSSILARQKQLGITINHELELQNQMLDELDTDVDRTQTKLKFANKKLQKIK